MSSLRRALIIGLGAAVSLLALGFVLFASVVTRFPADNNPHADGIVVLTGESMRIAEGARLLDEGRAQRMLISGVFRRTGKKALLEISGLPEDKFDCCVDIGYAALDTAAERFSFTPAEVSVAPGTEIEFRLTSYDTSHGFRILGQQIDIAIPKRGRGAATVRFAPPGPGTYVFECSRMCGAGHSFMRGTIRVKETADRKAP